MFQCHFEMIRLKIKCKEPTKIPPKRVFEDFEQVQTKDPKDDDDNDDNRPDEGGEDDDRDDQAGGDEEDDLLSDELGDNLRKKDKAGSGHATDPSAKSGGAGTSKASGGSAKQAQSVKQALLNFERNNWFEADVDKQEGQLCVNLLQAMNLEENESDMEETKQIDDPYEESSTLPEEWSYVNPFVDENGQVGRFSQPEGETDETIMDKGDSSKNLNTKPGGQPNKWIPIQAQRKSNRVIDDGRTTTEKAQALKRKVNLEEPKGKKSYVSMVLSKSEISAVASVIDVDINCQQEESNVISVIQEMDRSRCEGFTQSYSCSSRAHCPVGADLEKEQEEALVTPFDSLSKIKISDLEEEGKVEGSTKVAVRKNQKGKLNDRSDMEYQRTGKNRKNPYFSR